ncbi:peptidase C39-like protein [Kribbella orskensis]|uniref:Peptidase C39-like protein n=1 Tax=Kribbella orskensis TaxID=2512216 RepID=A0ABY2BLU6_9ACTN|nr:MULTISPECIES: peptidase C39 family protein [Kribbella]TCN40832.1 peptidase C39-like protein [Kribbella sp. VKM Ac-2500]TCO24084.1 peptidase C39-like protein [Kribbella orskensis]
MTAARALAALITGVLVLSLATVPSEAAKQPQQRDIAYETWTSTSDFLSGTRSGTTVADDSLTFGTSTGTSSYVDPFGDGTAKSYDQTSWTSPQVPTSFGLTELIASWNATTPPGTWVEVSMAGHTDLGTTTKWYVLGRWSSGDDTAAGDIHRTSVPSQGDTNGSVAVDTFVAATGRTLDSWQLKVTLYRLSGTTQSPVVRSVSAMASRLPDEKKVPASPLGGAEGQVLDVPTYSQETHIGHYPQWDGGGEAWCSATSTAMVLDYYGAGPTAADTAWVDPTDADPQVDHSARSVFDYEYDGAGNWPFNTAYAATRGIDTFVTRLRSLTEAEQFIKAGIPLVASLSFKKGDLPGAGYGTNGHLMVIVGFDAAGNVVVNDPASHLIASNDQVRTTYDREAFENAWVPHSGGLVYVLHPTTTQLPPTTGSQPNW